MHNLYQLFVGVVLILTILGAVFSTGPRYATYGQYVSILVVILAVCCTLRVFFGV